MSLKPINISQNKAVLFFLFWIFPIIPLYISIKRFNNKQYQFIIIMFAFLFGYSFIPYTNSDTERYMEFYNTISFFSFADYWQEIFSIYSIGARFSDAYLLTIMYLSSLFNASFQVFIGIQSMIYFSFVLGILNTILDQVKHINYKKYFVFFLGCIFIYSFSSGVNGIRFPTAFMWFSYFTLKYLFTNKNKFVLLAMLSIFVHVALLQPVLGLILLVLLSKVKSMYLKILLLLAFVIVLFGLNLQQLTQIVGNETVAQKVESYTDENYIQGRVDHAKEWNWYIRFNLYSNYYYLAIVVLLSSFRIKGNDLTKKIFIIVAILFIISLYNELFLDPISNRYRKFFELFALVYLIILYAFSKEMVFKKILRKIFMFIVLITILIQFRSLSYNIDVLRVMLSPFINLLDFDGVNIYDLL